MATGKLAPNARPLEQQRLEAVYCQIRAMLSRRFSGSLTVHFHNGRPMKIETREVRAVETVDIGD